MARKKHAKPKAETAPKVDPNETDKEALERLFPAPVIDAAREAIKSTDEKQKGDMA
jgi:hypothetical protein